MITNHANVVFLLKHGLKAVSVSFIHLYIVFYCQAPSVGGIIDLRSGVYSAPSLVRLRIPCFASERYFFLVSDKNS